MWGFAHHPWLGVRRLSFREYLVNLCSERGAYNYITSPPPTKQKKRLDALAFVHTFLSLLWVLHSNSMTTEALNGVVKVAVLNTTNLLDTPLFRNHGDSARHAEAVLPGRAGDDVESSALCCTHAFCIMFQQKRMQEG